MIMSRPPKYNTPEEMQRIVDLYFLACKAHQTTSDCLEDLSVEDLKIVNEIDDFYPTVTGLALTLDMSRQALIEYEKKDEFIDTVKKAKQKVEAFLEQRLYHQNATGTIFNLKNNYGWKDKTETEIHAQVKDISDKPLETPEDWLEKNTVGLHKKDHNTP